MTFLEEIITQLESDPEFFPETHTHCYSHINNSVVFVDISGNNPNLYRSFPRGVKILNGGVFTNTQYEAALSASTQVEWSGQGLPPVGTKCELYNCGEWVAVKIKYIGVKYVIAEEIEEGEEGAYELAGDPGRFRPIRTEAERKREDVLTDLAQALGHAHGLFDLLAIYKAIQSGKVRHITLK